MRFQFRESVDGLNLPTKWMVAVTGVSVLILIMLATQFSRLQAEEATAANELDWQFQTLEVRGDVGAVSDMHYSNIAYQVTINDAQTELKFARFNGYSWESEVVDTLKMGGVDLDLFIRSRPHISYYDAEQGNLKYATVTESGWATEVVTGTHSLDVGQYSSIIVEQDVSLQQDKVHIIYYDSTNKRLMHATKANSVWSFQEIDGENNSGQFNELVISNNSRNLHLVYAGDNLSSLKHGVYADEKWTIQKVDDSQNANPSIVVNDFEEIMISSYDFDGVHYYKSSFGEDFRKSTVAAIPNSNPLSTSIQRVIGISEHIAILYPVKNQTTGKVDQLMLAELGFGPEGWRIEAIPYEGSLGQRAIIKYANSGPKILFYDDQYQNMIYGAYVGANENWSKSLVEPDYDVYSFSFEIDEYGLDLSYIRDWWAVTLIHADRCSICDGGEGFWERTFITELASTLSSIGHNSSGEPIIATIDSVDNSPTLRLWEQAEDAWSAETSQPIGTSSDSLELEMRGDRPFSIYVHEFVENGDTVQRLQIAFEDKGTQQLATNTSSPAISEIGQISTDMLSNGSIVITYQDASDSNLRFARWDGANWFDEEIASSGNVGEYHAVVTENSGGASADDQIAIVYTAVEGGNEKLVYAHKTVGDASWQTETLQVDSVNGINSLDLALNENGVAFPLIAYTLESDNTLRLIEGLHSAPQTVAQGDGNLFGLVDIEYDYRPRIAYRDDNNLLALTYPTLFDPITGFGIAPLHANSTTGQILGMSDKRLLDIAENYQSETGRLRANTAADGTLSDEAVLAFLASSFAQSEAGQAYLDNYLTYGPEIIEIGFQNPDLLWGSYQVLHNFMPALEAFVEGSSGDVVLTQNQIDNALDIWQRISAEASPELAATINSELEASNNLQDFVGMTMTEWGAEIGVAEPAGSIEAIYLPMIRE